MSAILQWANLTFQSLGTSYPRLFGVALQTETKSQWPCPRNCYVGNMKVRAVTGSSGDITTTLILRVNGRDSSLRVTLGVGVLEGSNGSRVLVSAGDLLSLASVVAGSAGSAYTDIIITAELQPIPFAGAAP